MNIAVCDDQLDYLNLIKKKLIECFHEPEMELNGRSLVAAADHILLDSEVWQRMHMASLKLATTDASDKMIEEMMSLIRAHRH